MENWNFISTFIFSQIHIIWNITRANEPNNTHYKIAGKQTKQFKW